MFHHLTQAAAGNDVETRSDADLSDVSVINALMKASCLCLAEQFHSLTH